MENNKDQNKEIKQPKTPKKKGPIRWEAILPFSLIAILIYVYFHFFFDSHFKKGLELAGYHGVGAEVNIDSVETSLFNASIHIHRVQLTNSEAPDRNMIEIGDLRFGMLWDALLRGKIVINEATIEQIAFDTKRAYPGRVKPPEPISNEPSLLEKEGTKLANEAIEKTKENYEGNVLGDIAALLSGANGNEQLEVIKSQIKSKGRLDELNAEFKAKQLKWKEKLESLPNQKTIAGLSEKFAKIKTKNFKSPQELQDSLKQIEALAKEANGYVKEIQTTGTSLNSELKVVDTELKELEKMIQQDIKDLEARFKIPKIDANSITKSLLARYADPYLGKFHKYHKMAQEYLPPNLINPDKKEKDEEIDIQPRARAQGISYEFGRLSGYPFFWVKRAMVSSKSNPENPMIGDLKGEITNITSNQPLLGKPTVFNLNGNFPGLEINGLSIVFTMNHVHRPFTELLEAKVASYPVAEKTFVNSDQVNLGFTKAIGSTNLNVKYSDSILNFDFKNEYKSINYLVEASNAEFKTVLTDVFKSIPMIDITANGSGKFPNVAIDLQSNLGPEISNALAEQIRKKVEEAKAKVKRIIDETVANEKEKFQKELAKLKAQIEGEVKKVQDQADREKKNLETKVKDTQKQAEKDLKKKLETDGKKKLEDLKKQLGL